MSISRFASLTTLLLAIMLTGAACNSSGSAGTANAAAEKRAAWRTLLVADILPGGVRITDACCNDRATGSYGRVQR
jgi:hypothetical protein